MKRVHASKPLPPSDQLVCGLFSKKEAAGIIGKGTRHLHSSTLGSSDPCARVTQQNLDLGKQLAYPWEKFAEAARLHLGSSADRYEMIETIIQRTGVTSKRDLKEKVQSVLEELFTNAIYHGYRNEDGSPRFPRRLSAKLDEKEHVEVRYLAGAEGIYLAVTDQAGSLSFENLSRSIARCYQSSTEQIETKEGGAGLGTYMIFEATTHLKIAAFPGRQCTISCWLAEKSFFDPDSFSFNFYQGR